GRGQDLLWGDRGAVIGHATPQAERNPGPRGRAGPPLLFVRGPGGLRPPLSYRMAAGFRSRGNRSHRAYESYRPYGTILGVLVRPQPRQNRLLRDLHLPHLLHALLARRLLGPQLALAGDVAAVALRRHVLAHRRDRLAGDHPAADRRLDGDLEHVPVDLATQL